MVNDEGEVYVRYDVAVYDDEVIITEMGFTPLEPAPGPQDLLLDGKDDIHAEIVSLSEKTGNLLMPVVEIAYHIGDSRLPQKGKGVAD